MTKRRKDSTSIDFWTHNTKYGVYWNRVYLVLGTVCRYYDWRKRKINTLKVSTYSRTYTQRGLHSTRG